MASRHRLLARTALGGVALLAAGPGLALPGNPVNIAVNPGGAAPIITNPTAGTLDIDFNAARTVLQYNGFTVGQGETVNLRFDARSDIGVIHNVGQEALSVDGALRSYVGAQFGGNVWLLSSTGVFFGGNAQVDVGGLVASTAVPTNLLSAQGGFLDTTTLSFDFANGAGQVSVAEGARLTGNGGSLAFIAPNVVTNAGSTIGGGGNTSVLYGAAERFTVRFVREAGNDLDLLDFEVPGLTAGSDSSVPLSILGSTTAGNIYLASVGKVATVSALLSADGPMVATSAGVEGGSIVLTSGGGIANRAAAPLFTDGAYRQSISANGDSTAANSITAQATGSIFAYGSLSATAGSIVMTGVSIDGYLLSAGQDVVLRSGDALGSTGNGYGYGYGVYGPEGGSVRFGSIDAGDDVFALAYQGDIAVGSVVLAGTGPDAAGDPLGLDSANDGRRLLLRTTGAYGDIRLGFDGEGTTDALTGGTDTRLESTGLIRVVSSGAVTLTGAVAKGAGSNLQFTEFATDGALTIGSVSARGAIVAVSDTSVAIGSATTSFDDYDNGQIAVRGGTTATLTSADAASDVIVVANGDATVGMVRAGDDVIVRAYGGTARLNGATVATGDSENGDEGEGSYGPDVDGNRINTGYGYGYGYGFAIFGDLSLDSDGNGRRIDLAALTLFQGEGVPVPGGDAFLGLGTGQIFDATGVSVVADRDVFVDLLGDAGIDILGAGRNAVVTGAENAFVGSLNVSLNASVTARSGDAYVASGSVGGDLTIAAPGGEAGFGEIGVGQDLLVNGRTADLGSIGGFGEAGGPRDITIRTTGGDLYLFQLSAERDIRLDVVGDVDAFGLSAGGSISVTATGSALFGIGGFDRGEPGQILADLDFSVTAADILLRPGTQVSIGRDATLTATNSVDVQTYASAGDDFRISAPIITIDSLYAGVDGGDQIVDSEGDGSNIVLAGTTIDAIELRADNDVRATATGQLGIGDAECEGECFPGGVFAGNDAVLSGASFRLDAPIVAGNDAILSSTTGSLDLSDEDVQAGQDLILTSTGSITLGFSRAERDLRLTAATVVDAEDLDAGRDISVTAADMRVGRAFAGQSEGGAGSIVLTGGTIAAGYLSANGGDVRATASGALTISASACNTCEGSGISASNDIVLRGASVSLEGSFYYAGRDLKLTTTVAGFTGADLYAGQDVIIDTAGALSLATVTAGRDAILRGASVGVDTLLPGRDARVTARSGDAVVVTARTPRDLSVLAALGLASIGTANVGGNLLLSGATVALGSVDAFLPLDGYGYGYGPPVPTFDVTIAATAGGFSYDGILTAANDLRITVSGALVLSDTATAVRDMALDGGSVSVASLSAARGLSVTARSGNVSAADLTSDGDVTVTASGAIELLSARAGDDVVLTAGGAVDVTGSLVAGRTGQGGVGPDSEGDGQNIRVTGGAVTLAGLDAPTDAVVTGDTVGIANVATRRDALVTARTGDAVVGAADVRRDLSVVAANGLARIGSATVGRDLLLSGRSAQLGSLGGYLEGQGYGYGQTLIPTRDITIAATAGDFAFAGTLAADRDLDIRASGTLTLGTVTARDDVRLGGGAVTVATARALGGIDSDGDGSNLFVTAASFSGRTLSAVTDLIVTTTGTAGVGAGGGSATAGRDIVVTGATLDLGTLTATRDLRLTATASGIAAVATLTSGRDIVLDASGAVIAEDFSATRDLSLIGASVDVGALGAGRDLSVTARNGLAAVGSATAGDDARFTGTSVRVSQVSTTGTAADTEGDGSTIVATGGDVRIDAADAFTDLLVTATGIADVGISEGGARAARDIVISGGTLFLGSLDAGRDLSLTATASGFDAGNLSAVRNLTVDAAGPLSFATADAGGNLLLAGIGITGGSATAAGDATLDARTGTLGVALVSAGDDVRLAGAAIDVEQARTTGLAADGEADGSDIVATGGTVTIEIAEAANDIRVTGSGAVALGIGADGSPNGQEQAYFADADGDIVVAGASVLTGPLTAGRDILLTATAGAIDARGTLDAGRDMLGSATARIDATTVFAARDVRLGGVGLTFDAVSAGRDAALAAGSGRLEGFSVRAGDDVLLTGAIIAVANALGAGDGIDDEQDGSNLVVTGGIVQVTAAQAAADVRVTASGSVIIGLDADGGMMGEGVYVVQAGRDVVVDGASILAGPVFAGRDARLTASSGDAVVSSASVFRDLTVLAAAGLAQIGDAAVGQDFVLSGARVVLGSLSGYEPGYGYGYGNTSPRDVTLTATAGDILGGASLRATRDLRVMASGAVALGDLDAGALLEVDAGGALSANSLSAGGDLTATARTGSATLGDATAGDDVRIAAALDLTLGTVDATGSATDSEGDGRNIVLGGRAISLVSATATDDVRIAATGALTVSGEGTAIVAGRDVILSAASLSPGGISAGRDLSLTATASGIAAGDLSAARDLTLDAAGALTFGNLDAVRDLRLAGASVDGGNASAGGLIGVIARSGGATLGDLDAGGNVGVDAAGAIDLGGVSGSDVTLAGAVIGAAAIDSVGDVTVTARSGNASIGAVTAGDDVRITVGGGAVTGQSIFAGGGTDGEGDGGNVVIDAGSIVVDAIFATTDVVLTSAGALSTGGGITAGRDALLTAASLTPGSISAGRDLVLTATAGDITASNLSAARDLIADATGALNFGTLSATRDLVLSGASLDGSTATAGGDVTVTARSGNAVLADTRAGDDVRVTAAQDATLGAVIASGMGADSEGDGSNIVVAARDIALTSASAPGDIRLTATGALSVTGAGTGVVAGRDVVLVATSLAPSGISAGRDLSLTATAGDIVAGDLSAARDLIADATGALTFGALTATRDLILTGASLDGRGATAGGDVTATARSGGIALADTSAGDDVQVTAAQDVTLGRVTATGAGADSEGDGSNIVIGGRAVSLTSARAPGDVRVTASGALGVSGEGDGITAGRDAILVAASLSPAGVSAGRDLSLTATASGIAGGTLAAVRNLTVAAAGPLSFGTATAGGALVLTATSIAGTTATAGTDLTATATGALTLATATAGDDVRLTGGNQSLGTVRATGLATDSEGDGSNVVLAGGAITAAQLSAANDVGVTGTGAVNIAQASAGRDVVVTGGSVGGALQLSGRDVAVTTAGAFAATGGIVASRDLRLTAGTTLSFAQLTAARDLILTGPVVQGGTAIATRDLTVVATTRIAGDRFEAGRNLSLDPDEAITAAVVRAGGDATLIGRSIDVGILDVGGVTFAQATNGGIALDSFTGRGNATLIATGRVSLGAATTGALRIVGGDLDVRRSLVASSLQVETPGRMILGGTEGDSGFVLAAADIARLRVAGTASFYAALTSGQGEGQSVGGDLIIRDFGYNPADLPRLALFADRNHAVDVQGRVLPSVGGGFIQIGDANPLGRFRPDSIYVSGSFGFAELDVNCFGKVVAVGELAFYAVNDVIFGLADFRAAVRATPAAEIDVAGGVPAVAGPRDDRLFAVANRFTVDAGGKIVSQNTASQQGNYVGLFFNGTGATGPIISLGAARAIDLSGSLVDSRGNLRSGPTVAFAGELGSGNGALFNGCLIGATSCGAGGSGATPSEAMRLEEYDPPRPVDLTDEPLSTIILVDQQQGAGDSVIVTGETGGSIVIRRRPGGN